MARFQAADSLRRVVPGATRAIPVDRSASIVARGVQDAAGQLIEGLERQDQFSLNKARSDLLGADIEARKALEKDPNFETHEKTYRDAMAKARDAAGGSIKNPARRAEFDLAAKEDIERGALVVYGVARQKRAERGRADLDARLQANRTAALNAKDPATRKALIDSTRGLLQSSVDEGFIDADVAENTWQAWQESYAEGYAAMLPPEEREAALKDPVGTPLEPLPPDKVALLLRATQSENKETRVRGQAQSEGDRIWAAGGSMEAMRKRARGIDDPDVRDATIAQLEARRADQEADREVYDRQNRRAAWEIVAKEGATWDDVPASLAARMDPEDQVRIKNYLREGKAVKTDPETYYTLRQAQAADPAAFAEFDLMKLKDKLGEEDFETFADAQVKIRDDAHSMDSTRTDLQMVNSTLEDMGIDTGAKAGDKDRQVAADFTLAYDRARAAHQRDTGKAPNAEEKTRILDNLSMEVVTKRRPYWRDETKRLFETTAGEEFEVDVPDEDRAQIVAAFKKKRGVAPTEAQIQDLYLRARSL